MSFFRSGLCHPEYLKMRDDPSAVESAEWFEELWRFYEPYNPDRHFLQRAAENLHSAWWQMYVAYCLARHNHVLAQPGSFGPDIRVLQPVPLWIEAICPEPGTGTDAAVRNYVAQFEYRLDRRAMILRYTAALEEKNRQRERHIAGSVVEPGEPYLVAIGASQIADADLIKDIPEIVKAVMGIGDAVFVVPIGGDTSTEDSRTQVTFRHEVHNKNSAAVRTDGFVSGAFPGISGVIFSARLPWGKPKAPGREMIFVQNPTADVQLDPECIGFGIGYRVARNGDEFTMTRIDLGVSD